MSKIEISLLVLIIFGILWYFRSLKLKNKKLELNYSLFKLRDEIRLFSINHEENKEDWYLQFMDESICKTIENSNHLNIYIAILSTYIYKKNKNLNRFKEKLNREINKNKNYKVFDEKYKDIVFKYILEKHFAFRSLIKVFILFKFLKLVILKYREKTLKNIVVSPELTESIKYSFI